MANKHKEKCLISLVIKEMQLKITIRYHYTYTGIPRLKRLIVANSAEYVEELNLLHNTGGNAKW